MGENREYSFYHPVRAKILPRFQFEGKTEVWISQVRHFNNIIKVRTPYYVKHLNLQDQKSNLKWHLPPKKPRKWSMNMEIYLAQLKLLGKDSKMVTKIWVKSHLEKMKLWPDEHF